MEYLQSADFWIGLLKIVWINIILSGDNAVVIALAARSLPPAQQKKAVMFGSGAAVVLRIILTVVAAKLLELSFLQIVGGCLLLWIGLQLLTGEEDDEGESKGHGSMMVAIRTILIADLVMSLDNVIARHHHAGRRPDRLGRRRNHRQRPPAARLRHQPPLAALCGGRSRRRAGRGHWQVPAGALRRKARSPGLTLPQAAPSPHHERTAPAVRFCFVRTHLDVASS